MTGLRLAPTVPDLNPIENLWALIKKQLSRTHYNSPVELKAKITYLCLNIREIPTDKLALSMKDRLTSVIKAKEGSHEILRWTIL